MKNFYLLAASLLLLGACGKDDDSPALSLPGEYKAENRIVATSIHMYTSNGQVNNPALVDNFIRRYRADSYFSRTDTPAPVGNSLTLSISSSNKATFVSTAPAPQRPDTLKTEILSRSQEFVVLAELDSISVLSSAPANRCAELSQNMMQVQPNKRCRAVSIVTGYSQQCRYRPASALLIKDGGLRLPLFSWLVKSQQGGNFCGNGYSNVRNLFNSAVLNQLVTGDTIVVQVREVPFTKQ